MFGIVSKAQSKKFNNPIVDSIVIFEEKNGLVAVEAEHFYKQSNAEVRAWYRTSKTETANVGRDEDAPHFLDASNNAYIEILPDTRVTHSDQLIRGENFTDEAGKMAIVHYKVKFNTPGRYFVWVRAMSTGSEDNGLHVGLNNQWPAHGKRMQWCDGKNKWTWESKQRTKEVHCGVAHEIYLDIEKPGVHNIQFSMREDGFEMDKFILTTDKNYVPSEKGPAINLAQGKLPVAEAKVVQEQSYFNNISKALPENKVIASQEFPVEETNFYKNGKNWLAINPKEHKEAQTSTTFNFESGKYDVVFVGVGENDGSSTFSVSINNKLLGTYAPPLAKTMWEEGREFNALWRNIKLKKGDKITVTAKVGTDGKEFTRGRWAGIIFTPVGKGKQIQESPTTYLFIK
ncbi:hypothetical protein [Lutibacter sp. HS1-25]|uniref:hypothetical protein n=1 Tax=Lutibacter sp. HS1-25 TaxID=2485000 RepID=UPI0013E90981|nr:hypothetical protein [Lutibacter sp. HS1-25]